MITRVGKWGNSLAIRVPREIIGALNLRRGEVVDIEASLDGRHIIVHKIKALTPKERGER